MTDHKFVLANGVELCVETFGDAGDPAILLIGGATCSMDWWEDEFCERLALGPRFVIRRRVTRLGGGHVWMFGSRHHSGADAERSCRPYSSRQERRQSLFSR